MCDRKKLFLCAGIFLILCTLLYSAVVSGMRSIITDNFWDRRLKDRSIIGLEPFTGADYDYALICRRPLDYDSGIPPEVLRQEIIDDNVSLLVLYRDQGVCDVIQYPLNVVFVTSDRATIRSMTIQRSDCAFQVEKQDQTYLLRLMGEAPEGTTIY